MKTFQRKHIDVWKRLSDPAFNKKSYALKNIVKGFLIGLNPFIHLLFIKNITSIIEFGDYEGLVQVFVFYTSYIFIYELLLWLIRRWGWYASVPQYISYLTEKYLKKYIYLDNNKIEKIGTGRSISIIERGIEQWAMVVDMFLFYASTFFITVIFAFLIILNISLLASVIFICFYTLVIYINVNLNKKMLLIRSKRTDEMNFVSKGLIRVLMSKNDILQNDKINSEFKKINKHIIKGQNYNLQMAPYFHAFFQIPQLSIYIIKLSLLFILGKLIFEGRMTMVEFVAIFGAMVILESSIVKFVEFFKNVTKDLAVVYKLWDFFDSTPDIKCYNKGKNFEYKKGKVEIKDLEFGYNKKQKVFEKFNLKIEGGKITALVGNSGSGKSTLVKLISGYIRQDSGKIKVDGQNLEKVSLKSYYQNIGYLTQEPSVFDGTIYDNLTYAVDRKLEEGELSKIIKLAKCEFIYELESGIQTEIGEKGIRLSGGQRQRLAIAKIFLKDPKIIILDEPTSALDSFSEEQITKAMHNLFKGRTVIIIAHRLQTVKNADRILVLENGKVVEEGDHKELVKQKGVYKKMLDLQSGF